MGLGQGRIIFYILFEFIVCFTFKIKKKRFLKQLNEAPIKNKKDPKLYFAYVGRLLWMKMSDSIRINISMR